MSIRTIFGAAAASVLLLAGAQAADVVVEEVVVAPAPPAPDNWTGIYAGVHAGYGWGDSDWNWALGGGSFWATGATTGGSLSPDGFIGGGQVGYLHQNNNLVFGVDVSLSYADLDQTIASPAFPGLDTWQTEIDFLTLAQLRVGYAQDNWLIFAQGGYAGANVEATATASFGGPPVAVVSDSQWQSGWTIGGGGLYRFNQNWSFGAEYSYIDFGSDSFNLPSGFGPSPDPVNVDNNIHAVKATLNFHFGGN